MKKQTISAILTALMICLVLAIVVLVVRIQMRGPKPEETAVSENEVVMNEQTVSENMQAEPVEEEVETVLLAIPQATSSVNVRSGPGTEYERIGSAYSDCEYEVVEIYDSGWTKLLYEGQEGYISSEYLIFRYRSTTSGGTISYMDVDISELEMVGSSAGNSNTTEDSDGGETTGDSSDEISETTDTTTEGVQ